MKHVLDVFKIAVLFPRCLATAPACLRNALSALQAELCLQADMQQRRSARSNLIQVCTIPLPPLLQMGC